MARFYRTQQGDTWDWMAMKLLGSQHMMHKLIEHNFYKQDYAVFPEGVKIRIPEVETSESTAVQENLPPWKQSRSSS